MTEMVEKVARAIYEMQEGRAIAFGALPTWEKIGDYDRALYHDMARAAIEAMREPNDAALSD